ncbi:MAG: hypothetical protein ACJAXH_002577 [Colwellia sp.]
MEADPIDKQATDKWDDYTKTKNTLSSFLFAVDVIKEMEDLSAYLQRQRRSFEGWGRGESPRLHYMMLGAQKNVLNHIMHPNVTMRLTDSMFKADTNKDVNFYRRNL